MYLPEHCLALEEDQERSSAGHIQTRPLPRLKTIMLRMHGFLSDIERDKHTQKPQLEGQDPHKQVWLRPSIVYTFFDISKIAIFLDENASLPILSKVIQKSSKEYCR